MVLQQVHPDWDEATSPAVGGLRALFAEDPDDPRLRALIDELSSSNERFTQLWERAEVGYTKGVTHLRHPDVGDLYLTRTKLDLANTGGAHIITWHAPPHSTSAQALDQLRASLPKTRRLTAEKQNLPGQFIPPTSALPSSTPELAQAAATPSRLAPTRDYVIKRYS
jgi:hypothetical protein